MEKTPMGYPSRRPRLLDDLIKEGVGEVLLDLLLEIPIRREIADIGLIGTASTSGEHPEDTAIPIEDDRA